MAQALLIETDLRLVFETGVNEKGEIVYKSKTLNNVKNGATAEQLFQVAQAISSLSNYPLCDIVRSDQSDIFA